MFLVWPRPELSCVVTRSETISGYRNYMLNHELRRVVNRNTVKVSYSTMPNMAQANKRHNNKVLGGDQVENWELHGQGRRLWCRGDRAHHRL